MEKKRRKISERQAAIGARLREARRFLGLSQTALAESIGINRVRLDSYESGRVPMRCEVALRVCRHYQVSEDWLATGGVKAHGFPRKPYRFGPGCRASMFKPGDPILDQVKLGALFSDAYDSVLKLEYWKLLGEAARTWTRFDFSTDDPEEMQTALDAGVSKWALMIPDCERGRFYEALIKCGMLLFVGLYNGPVAREDAKQAEKLPIEKAIEEELEKSKLKESPIEELTSIYAIRKYESMQSPLKVLLARVATLTKARGKKSDLSKRINVPLSRVSEWLHGKGEPTGDSVLRLQNWVAAEEEKQQKSPGDVTSATKGNARKRNPENEHQKAGPRGR